MALLSPESDITRGTPPGSPTVSIASSRTAPSPPPATLDADLNATPAQPPRSQYTVYSQLVQGLAARDASDLGPRLAGTGMWAVTGPPEASNGNAVASSSTSSQRAPGPTWVTSAPAIPAPSSVFSSASRSRTGTAAVEVDELMSTPAGTVADCGPTPSAMGGSLSASPTRPFSAMRTLAPLIEARTPGRPAPAGVPEIRMSPRANFEATRWPLHSTEAEAAQPLDAALQEAAVRVVRMRNIKLPGGQLEPRACSNGVLRRKGSAPWSAPASASASVPPLPALDYGSDDDLVLPPHLAPALTVRVAAAVDRTLAGLAACRPQSYAKQRADMTPMSWTAVMGAAAMALDPEVVDRAHARLAALYAKDERPDTPAPALAPRTPTPAAAGPSSARMVADVYSARSKLLNAARRPRNPTSATDDLYVLPPTHRPVKHSKKERDERAIIAAAVQMRREAALAAKRETAARRAAKHRLSREKIYRKQKEKRDAAKLAMWEEGESEIDGMEDEDMG